MSSNRCWQQAFHRSNTHAWEVSPFFLLPRNGKRLQTSSSWNIPFFLNQLSRTTSWSGSHAMYFTPVQRNMYTGAKAWNDLNLRFGFDKHWKRSKSKHSIDWAPIPVFYDDPTCYLNAWDLFDSPDLRPSFPNRFSFLLNPTMWPIWIHYGANCRLEWNRE